MHIKCWHHIIRETLCKVPLFFIIIIVLALIIDGNSEYNVHAWKEFSCLICLRHYCTWTTLANLKFISKLPNLLHTCATCSELPMITLILTIKIIGWNFHLTRYFQYDLMIVLSPWKSRRHRICYIRTKFKLTQSDCSIESLDEENICQEVKDFIEDADGIVFICILKYRNNFSFDFPRG